MPRVTKQPSPAVAAPRPRRGRPAQVAQQAPTARVWGPKSAGAQGSKLAQALKQASFCGVRPRGKTIEVDLGLPPNHHDIARIVADARGVGIVPKLDLAPPNPRLPWPNANREPVVPAPPRPLTRDEARAVHANLSAVIATIQSGQALQQLKPDLPLLLSMDQRVRAAL